MKYSRTNQDALKRTLAIVLAGGAGERLYPLTKDRAKPAVPFAGTYRIIDFTLSNAANSGFRRIDVLTQYKSYSLQRHLQLGWNIFNFELGDSLHVIPPQQRMATMWYRGTSDAIYQNIYILERERPEYVLILSGDHIYKMDYSHMLRYHVERNADLTVACIEVTREEASRFGIMQVDTDNRIISFEEKPTEPKAIPGKQESFLGSMGVYIFKTEELVRQVIADTKRETEHDFGRNIIPMMVNSRNVYVYNYSEGAVGNVYWRDIGTIEAYWEASMSLLEPDPPFVLNDRSWPLRTYQAQNPPAKIISSNSKGTSGVVINSLLSPGCIVNNARLVDSVISPRVVIEPGATVESCVIFEDTVIGRGATVRNTIIDKNVHVPPGRTIGENPQEDSRMFTVTKSGLVVIPKEQPMEE